MSIVLAFVAVHAILPFLAEFVPLGLGAPKKC
jgi:hypothetical protein